MRLPHSKVYRAFPEFDKFDDARCEAYVLTIRRSEGKRGCLIGAAYAVAGVLVAFVLMIVLGTASALLSDRLDMRGRPWANTDLFLLAMLIVIVAIPLTTGILLALVLRDRHLRRSIARQIEGSRCPECAYLLLGLMPRDCAIRCPECGIQYTLVELGLTVEGLMPMTVTSGAT